MARLTCGLLLGFASACHDIVALDCDPRQPVTAECPAETGAPTSTSDASTVTSPTSVTATTDSDDASDASAEDPTGVADTGSMCGDGRVDPGEECDDADPIDIDECDNACRLPRCGDGRMQPGEDCDLGEANDDHGPCKLDCSAAICGDGIVRWGDEECDGEDFDGLSCEAYGYGRGELLCSPGCTIDPGLCTRCPDGGEACDAYQPCDMVCESGAACYSEMGVVGTCSPYCMGPDECPFFEGFAPDCTAEVCVIPCDQECPLGMVCQFSSIYPGMVCLW